MRVAIKRIFEDLLADSREGDSISIDTIGDAIGTMAIAPDEIDGLFAAIEKNKRTIFAPEGARGEANLKRVLDSARVLKEEKNAAASVAEIASHSGLTVENVRFALALAKVIQR